MPILITLRALLGSAFARIGGWIALALGALAFLKYRDVSARREGAATARQQQETRNAEAALDAVEISNRRRDHAARDELRSRHTRAN